MLALYWRSHLTYILYILELYYIQIFLQYHFLNLSYSQCLQTFWRSRQGKIPLGNKQIFSTSALEGYRETLVRSAVSERAANLSLTKRQNSSVNYSSWKKFSSWCYRKQTDPFQCSINYVLDFLGCLYVEGYEYRSINCCRWAISGYNEKIKGLPVGQHLEVCTLLTWVFNLRPPQPRYSCTWDVQIVLEIIKNNWTDNKFLPNKNLILKLTMLLTLTSASRTSIFITLMYASCPSVKKKLCSVLQNC